MLKKWKKKSHGYTQIALRQLQNVEGSIRCAMTRAYLVFMQIQLREGSRILITHSTDNLSDNTTGAKCTVRENRCASATGGRNSIITSGGGFARRQQECRATREEPWLCIRKRNDVGERRTSEGDASRRRRRRTSRPTMAGTTTETERRSPGARNSSSKCSPCDSGGDMRADKKLGNVLAPWIRVGPASSTTSYSELYRRRLS